MADKEMPKKNTNDTKNPNADGKLQKLHQPKKNIEEKRNSGTVETQNDKKWQM